MAFEDSDHNYNPPPLIESHVQEIDNTPDMDAAVDLEDNVGGKILDAWINKCFDEWSLSFYG